MTEVTLHATPRWRDVVIEQIRIVGLSMRREALIAGLVLLGVATMLVASDVAEGGPGFDSHEMFPAPVIAFLFPFAVWRSDKRSGPAFLWTLPVERRTLALAKVFAGWIWAMVALLGFASWLVMIGLAVRVSPAQIVTRVPVTVTTAMYLLGSALLLGLRHPVRWLLATVGALFLFVTFSEMLGRNATGEWRVFAWNGVVRSLVYGPYGARAILTSSGFFSAVEHASRALRTQPTFGQWAIVTFLWLAVSCSALAVALSRHKETR
jgi:hypothetical protein